MSDNKPNTLYAQILVTARKLFWRHGIRRVTVEEICREAGVSKMTFYKYFPNKVELAKIVYNNEIEKGIARFREIMHEPDNSPLDKMEKILLLKLEGTNEISREFMSDFYDNQQLGLASWVEKRSIEVWKDILSDFAEAQEQGWFRKDFRPEGMLIMINKLSEIIKDKQLLALYDTPQDVIMELARFFTFGILPREVDSKGKR